MEIRRYYQKRERTPITEFGESITQREFGPDSEINNIIERYNRTGSVSMNRQQPVYGDVSEVKSYQESLQTVIKAQEAFAQIPAAIRKRFGNDPAEYVAFLQKEENREEAERLGLIPKKKQTEPEQRKPETEQKKPE